VDQKREACGDANDQVLDMIAAFSSGFERHTVAGTSHVISFDDRKFFRQIVNLPITKFFTIGLLLLKNQYQPKPVACAGVLIRFAGSYVMNELHGIFGAPGI
jgi:hypothetical protein